MSQVFFNNLINGFNSKISIFNGKPKPIITCQTNITNMKRVILITGTPCTGKTTTSKQLVQKLNSDYINLTDFAKTYNLTLGKDLERQTIIINEEAMQQKLQENIAASNNANIIIDGHYAAAVTPTDLVSNVFVLRRNPKELKAFMKKSGFSEAKMWENLSAEILDSCLIEALQTQQGKVCELNVTGKTVDENVAEILQRFHLPFFPSH